MAQITLVEAVNLALKHEMQRDPNVVVLGEDVGVDGGVFRATLGLSERFGPERVIDTPLAEALIAGMAIGMAAEGLKPVAEIQFSGFAYTTIDQILNHAGRMRHRTQGRLSCPMVMRTPCGAGIHAPEHHSESPESIFAHIPGIRVVYPSSPRRAYGLLLAAIRDPDPVVFLEPTRLYRLFKEEIADDGQALPLDTCHTTREGNDVTVVAWGAMVHESLAAADTLAEQGVAAEVLDVATLKPLDMDTILASVARTGRCVIVTEAARTCSFASEIAAGLAEEGLLNLLAPVQRVTGYDVVVPLPRLEHHNMPGKTRIVAAAKKVLEFLLIADQSLARSTPTLTLPLRGRERGGGGSRSLMKIFKLPDLGEGLQEAEIVKWHTQVGDEIQADAPMVSVETAKAVVDIPAPYSGRIARLFGNAGDIAHIGAPLVGFEGESDAPDAGTVVGKVEVGRTVVKEAPAPPAPVTAGIKATPAVRALARKLNVDLAMVTATGADGLTTAADVQRAARILAETGPIELIRGVRRAMAQNMELATAEVASATIMDDADIESWAPGTHVLLRLIRALVAGCRAEPALNAWYDSEKIGRWLMKKIDIGIAVDTPDGLLVPVLRNCGERDSASLKGALEKLIADARARKIPPEELRANTFTLSNYGSIAGRYASPVVLPPTVAILGAGRIGKRVVVVKDQPAVRRMLPLSLTFDHRVVTGGEAGRFLNAVIADLQRPE